MTQSIVFQLEKLEPRRDEIAVFWAEDERYHCYSLIWKMSCCTSLLYQKVLLLLPCSLEIHYLSCSLQMLSITYQLQIHGLPASYVLENVNSTHDRSSLLGYSIQDSSPFHCRSRPYLTSLYVFKKLSHSHPDSKWSRTVGFVLVPTKKPYHFEYVSTVFSTLFMLGLFSIK